MVDFSAKDNPVVDTQDSSDLNQTPLSLSSAEGAEIPSFPDAAIVEKPDVSTEVQKIVEVETPPQNTAEGVDAPVQPAADIAPQPTASELPTHVVDLTTEHEKLHTLQTSQPLTQYADDEEAEFIEGVEQHHDRHAK